MYSVKEVYYTIQGEGYHTGRPAVFLRFTGCNLWNGRKKDKSKAICNFCDTDFLGTDGKNGGKYYLEKLISVIKKEWNCTYTSEKKFIVLTGGEPLLQVDDLLVKKLKKENFFIAVETNGTIKTNLKFDWVTVSPKENAEWNLRKGDELKVIYPQHKFNLKKIKNLEFKYFFLQPKGEEKNRTNILKTINYCKSHKPWFPSFQIHKSLGIS